jgi:hypothetical protein
MREVDIPTGISEASGDVAFSKIVRDFHWFGFGLDQSSIGRLGKERKRVPSTCSPSINAKLRPSGLASGTAVR